MVRDTHTHTHTHAHAHAHACAHTHSCMHAHVHTHTQLDMTNKFIEDLKSSADSNFHLAGTNLEKIVREKVRAVFVYLYMQGVWV